MARRISSPGSKSETEWRPRLLEISPIRDSSSTATLGSHES